MTAGDSFLDNFSYYSWSFMGMTAQGAAALGAVALAADQGKISAPSRAVYVAIAVAFLAKDQLTKWYYLHQYIESWKGYTVSQLGTTALLATITLVALRLLKISNQRIQLEIAIFAAALFAEVFLTLLTKGTRYYDAPTKTYYPTVKQASSAIRTRIFQSGSSFLCGGEEHKDIHGAVCALSRSENGIISLGYYHYFNGQMFPSLSRAEAAQSSSRNTEKVDSKDTYFYYDGVEYSSRDSAYTALAKKKNIVVTLTIETPHAYPLLTRTEKIYYSPSQAHSCISDAYQELSRLNPEKFISAVIQDEVLRPFTFIQPLVLTNRTEFFVGGKRFYTELDAKVHLSSIEKDKKVHFTGRTFCFNGQSGSETYISRLSDEYYQARTAPLATSEMKPERAIEELKQLLPDVQPIVMKYRKSVLGANEKQNPVAEIRVLLQSPLPSETTDKLIKLITTKLIPPVHPDKVPYTNTDPQTARDLYERLIAIRQALSSKKE